MVKIDLYGSPMKKILFLILLGVVVSVVIVDAQIVQGACLIALLDL